MAEANRKTYSSFKDVPQIDIHKCPVCGEYEFEEFGSYDICPICGWEDDPQEGNVKDCRGGANHMTVEEYRERWQSGDPECQPFSDDEEKE